MVKKGNMWICPKCDSDEEIRKWRSNWNEPKPQKLNQKKAKGDK